MKNLGLGFGLRKNVASMFCLLASVWCCPALASDFEVLGDVSVERVDNPTNVADSADKIEETQTFATLSMKGELENRFGRFITDAEYEERYYSEQKEQNEGLFLGSAELQFGRDNSRLFASLSHSAEELLINVGLGSSPENLDRRKLTEAMTSLRLGSSVDQVSLSAFAGQAKFDVSTENNSSQVGGLAVYERAVNTYTSTGLELEAYELDYDNFEDQSYEYRRASFFWRRELRYLSYSFNLGRNSVFQDFRDSSPFYNVEVAYDTSVNRLAFSFNQFLTDTSQGSDGQSFGSTSGPDGRLGVIDQYKRKEARLSWQSNTFCNRCSTTLAIGAQLEDYRTEVDEDSEEYFGQLAATYKMTQSVDFGVNVRVQDVQFVDKEEDYVETLATVGITWSNIIKRGRLRLYTDVQKRDTESDERSFTQKAIGLSFSYQLYSR